MCHCVYTRELYYWNIRKCRNRKRIVKRKNSSVFGSSSSEGVELGGRLCNLIIMFPCVICNLTNI